MKAIKAIAFALIFSSIPFWAVSQSSFKTFLHEKTYTDLHFTILQPSLQVALGYKFKEYLCVGVSPEFGDSRLLGLGVNLRGAPRKNNEQRFGFYYTAGWWHSVITMKDFESSNLLEIGAGIRYQNWALTTGYARNFYKEWVKTYDGGKRLDEYPFGTALLKFSYLVNTYHGENKMGKWINTWIFDKRPDSRYPNFFFDASLGIAGLSTGVLSDSVRFGTALGALELSMGMQQKKNLGFGISGILAFGDSNEAFLLAGVCLRGEPGTFYYKITLGDLVAYTLRDHEFKVSGETSFYNDGGIQPALQVQGGLRVLRYFMASVGGFFVPRVRGESYREIWDYSIGAPILEIREKRTVNLWGAQMMVGLAF